MTRFRKRLAGEPKIPNSVILAIGIFAAFVLIVLGYDVGKSFQGCVGVVDVSGEITMQRVDGGLLSETIPNAEDIADAIKTASEDDSVKAILLKIDSPGGSVVGSRMIRHAIDSTDKPVVAYLGEVAASGGYYIASGADYIVSDPNTITGSIGVIAVFADARDLLSKVGVNITAVTSGKNKGMGSFFEGLDGEKREIVQALINETYQEFRQVVIDGRGSRLNLQKFDTIADGRILSGRQALDVGMVDALGFPEDAFQKAEELSGYEELGTCNFKPSPRGAARTFSSLLSEVASIYSGGMMLR